ncbi:hypothetical protein JGU66_34665 [Myxococcaceae bacterium JPH2]|nr:hypothetical protein [Myxococcaceae bacterium JPH2]
MQNKSLPTEFDEDRRAVLENPDGAQHLVGVSPDQWKQVAKSGDEALSNLGACLASLKEDKITFTAAEQREG